MMWFRSIFLFFLLSGVSVFGNDFDTLRIVASLDTLNKQISGYVEYRLPEFQDLTTAEFQLFPNVYSSDSTAYLKDYKQLRNRLKKSEKWGWMVIDSAFISGADVSDSVKIEYTRGAINAGSSISGGSLRLHFTLQVPERGDRLSYNKGDYVLDGWYPRPAMLKADGTWYNPFYSTMAELVGDYYNFEVEFTAPAGYVIAASSGPDSTVQTEDSLNTTFYQIGPMHDFALALSPHYEKLEIEFNGVTIGIFLREFETPVYPRVRNAAEKTIEYMGKLCRSYPYRSLNYAFADVGFAGGIEMPGLIILSSPRGSIMATGFLDALVIHETVHEWFYGMVGSDQIETPWLDEAVTEYFTYRILREMHGDDGLLLDWWGLKVSQRDQQRFVSDMFDHEYLLTNPTYGFAEEVDYFGVIYSRGNLIVETADKLLGENGDFFWRNYFDTYRFKRPGTADFLSIYKKYSDSLSHRAVEKMLETPAFLDWSVGNLDNEIISKDTVKSSFILGRKGDIDNPVDYRIYFVSGDSLSGAWLPKYDREKIRIENESPIRKVVIDPDNVFAIDANLLNNSVLSGEDNLPGFRFSSGILFLVESVLSYLGGL